MLGRMRRLLWLAVCVAALFAGFAVSAGAETYTYPSMPSNWQNVTVTIGSGSNAVTLPLSGYPSGTYFSPEKDTMSVAEQKTYGFNLGYTINLRGYECMGFARYVYAALYCRYYEDNSIDTSLASGYSGSIYYQDMILKTQGTKELAPGYSASTLKTLITSCRPGAVMRVGYGSASKHSMVVMAIFNDGLLIYDNNWIQSDTVNVRPYTWQSFVDSFGSYGIRALQMPAYYPGYSYSFGGSTVIPENPTPTSEPKVYPLDTSGAGPYVVTVNSVLNVRAEPSVDGDWKGSLNNGTQVDVRGFYNGWAQITYRDEDCWVSADYLKKGTVVPVSFDANGGSAVSSSTIYYAGQKFGLLPKPTRTDRTFLGWYSGSTLYTESSAVPNVSSLTLKAKWSVPSFPDVPEDAWYAGYVTDAAARNLLTKGSAFRPADNATRAELITVLGREYEAETGITIYASGSSVFRDVSSSDYFAKYVSWANSVGIANGVSATDFAPNANVTREQLAEFLYRLAIFTGYTERTAPDVLRMVKFSDWGRIDGWAQSAVCWAVDVGILKGDDSGRVNPLAYATRSEMITMISRYVDFVSTAPRKASTAPETEPAEAVEDTAQEPELAGQTPETAESAEETEPTEETETVEETEAVVVPGSEVVWTVEGETQAEPETPPDTDATE